MKAEVDKLKLIKVVNFPISLNNLKTKEDDLDVGIGKLFLFRRLE